MVFEIRSITNRILKQHPITGKLYIQIDRNSFNCKKSIQKNCYNAKIYNMLKRCLKEIKFKN